MEGRRALKGGMECFRGKGYRRPNSLVFTLGPKEGEREEPVCSTHTISLFYELPKSSSHSSHD